MKRLVLLLACAALAAPRAAPAQAPADVADPNEVEAVVVIARRIGVPVWRVDNGRSTVVLVGQIQGVPKAAPWRSDELERAVAGADSVLFPHDIRASPADIARILWRARSIVLLPKGAALADYVDAATLERLRPFRQPGDNPRLHPWFVADELLQRSDAGELLDDDRVTDAVARAARRHRKPRQAVGVQHASRVVDRYLAGPATHLPCLQAALETAEAGAETNRARIAAWTRSRVPEVVRAPAEKAYDLCWPGGAVRETLRSDWRGAIDARLAAPGVTVAVAPLLYLAEEGGVLDRLVGRGLEVDGPRWRAEATPGG